MLRKGLGKLCSLNAEAGIGKSRLVEALKEKLSTKRVRRLECRCSPYHRNSPLFPIVDLLGRIFELDRAGSAHEKVDRLRTALARQGFTLREDLKAIASLLSLPLPADPRGGAVSERQSNETLRLLLRLFLAFSAEQPVLFVLEDLHWADPTTLDFLGLVADQGPTARLLTILTFRPSFTSPWENRGHINHLTLGPLSYGESERLVERLTSGRKLPPDVLKQILSNSDGVPLFIEELTKTVLESGALQEIDGAYELTKPLSSLAIPATLQDSLMARLDRLGGAKEVAQLASVLGRTFSYQWLEAISTLGEPLLRKHLSRLTEAELLYQRGIPPDATYTFKHALIKDAAYFSLMPRARQQYHQRIARALEQRFPEIKGTEPELLARHYGEAGQIEKAVSYWQLAGQQAVKRTANVEAAAHFRKGLDCLRTLPETSRRRQRQLDLVIALGVAQVATMGYAAEPVGEAFSRARELCGQVGESPQLFDALQGLYGFHLVRAELKTSLELSDRLIELAARLEDVQLGLEATLRRGISSYTLGDLTQARDYLAAVVAQSEREGLQDTALRFGQDRVVASLSHLSLVLWLLGFPDQAVVLNQKAIARAEGLSHPFSVAFALLYSAIVRSLRREHVAGTRMCRNPCGPVPETRLFLPARSEPDSRGLGASGRRAGPERDRTNPAHAIKKTRATGAGVLLPYDLALLTDACLRVGQIRLGLDVSQEALAVVERTGERFFKAELERLSGELVVASGADREESAAWFARALETARGQSANSLELRTAMSLTRIERGVRRRVEEVLHRFGEGFDTADLCDARDLLQQSD